MDLIDVLDTESHDVKSLQKQDAYYIYIHNTLTIPSVKNKITTKDNTVFKIIQDGDKSFEAYIIPKSLALTILVNSPNLQGHTGTNKTYFLIKRDIFWKEMHKDAEKCIQTCHICRQHDLQK